MSYKDLIESVNKINDKKEIVKFISDYWKNRANI